MKWLLRPAGNKNDNWKPYAKCTFGLIVEAETEEEARSFAKNTDVNIDSMDILKTRCEQIIVKGEEVKTVSDNKLISFTTADIK